MGIPSTSSLGFAGCADYGDAIIKRLHKKGAPKMAGRLDALFEEFIAAHKAYGKAQARCVAALKSWDKAAKRVSDADVEQDAAIDELAKQCINTDFGTRTKPLRALTSYSPTALQKAAFSVEAHEIVNMSTKPALAKAPAAVKRAAADAGKKAKVVLAVLKDEALPKQELTDAQIARAKALTPWEIALERFKLRAEAEWMDNAGRYEGVFEDVSREQKATKQKTAATKKRNAKKKQQDGATPVMKGNEIKVKGGAKQTRKTTTTTTEEVVQSGDGAAAGDAATGANKTVS